MTSPSIDRRQGLLGSMGYKAPVTVLAAANITQSGEQTIDSIAVLATNSAGVPDRVLCTGMTDTTKNGIWDVSTAAWTRSLDANGNYDLGEGTTVLVNRGNIYGGSYWRITSTGRLTIGSSVIAWARALASSISTLSFLQSGSGTVTRGAQDKMREQLSVVDFGAVGDGVTNDTAAFTAAIEEAYARGGGDVLVPATASGYRIQSPQADQRGVRLRPNVNIRGVGGRAKLVLWGNSEWLFGGFLPTVYSTITNNTTLTTTVMTVLNAALFSVGDTVNVNLGGAPRSPTTESAYWYYAKVLAVDLGLNTLALDMPASYVMSAGTTDPFVRKVIKMDPAYFLDGVTIENLYLYNSAAGGNNAEHGVFLFYGRNITIRNVGAWNPGAGIVVALFIDNFILEDLAVDSAEKQGQASKGRVLSLAGCRTVRGNNIVGRNFAGTFYVGEAQDKNVELQNVHIINNYPARSATLDPYFALLEERSFHVRGLYVEGNKGTLLDFGGTSFTPPYPLFENTRIEQSACDITDTVIAPLSAFEGSVELGATTLGTRKRSTVKVAIAALSAPGRIDLPAGRVVNLTMYTSNKTGLYNSIFIKSASGGVVVPAASVVNAGITSLLANYSIGRDYPLNDDGTKYIEYYSDGTVVANSYFTFEIDYFADAETTALDVATYTG